MNEYEVYEYYMLMVSKLAAFLQISSVELNVYLFLFVIPASFTLLTIWLVIQGNKLRKLKKGYRRQRRLIRQLQNLQGQLEEEPAR
jgi:hypothetical protein